MVSQSEQHDPIVDAAPQDNNNDANNNTNNVAMTLSINGAKVLFDHNAAAFDAVKSGNYKLLVALLDPSITAEKEQFVRLAKKLDKLYEKQFYIEFESKFLAAQLQELERFIQLKRLEYDCHQLKIRLENCLESSIREILIAFQDRLNERNSYYINGGFVTLTDIRKSELIQHKKFSLKNKYSLSEIELSKEEDIKSFIEECRQDIDDVYNRLNKIFARKEQPTKDYCRLQEKYNYRKRCQLESVQFLLRNPKSLPSTCGIACDENKDVAKQQFLNARVFFDIRDSEGNTLLYHAADKANFKMAKLLIDLGANMESRNLQGKTPLNAAKVDNKNEFMFLIYQCSERPMTNFIIDVLKHLEKYEGAHKKILNSPFQRFFHNARRLRARGIDLNYLQLQCEQTLHEQSDEALGNAIQEKEFVAERGILNRSQLFDPLKILLKKYQTEENYARKGADISNQFLSKFGCGQIVELPVEKAQSRQRNINSANDIQQQQNHNNGNNVTVCALSGSDTTFSMGFF